MRSVRLRYIVLCVVLLAAGAGAWQLLPSAGARDDPITVGTTDEVTSLDPAGAYDAGSWALYSNVFQSLLTFEPGSPVPVPDAAEGCEFTGLNLQTYRCELRDDLRFSSGRQVTAEDVKYSFDRVLAIGADVGPRALFPALRRVDADGSTVTFHLGARDATFPQKLATGAGAIVDRDRYPRGALREGHGVDGSGPYVLAAYEPGVRALLEPNPRYRGAVRKPGGPVEIRYFKDSDGLAAAWKARQVDVTHRQLPPRTVAGMDASAEGVQMTEAGSAETRNLVFNVRPGSPMADKAVRRAVAALVDRPALVTGAYHSTVEPLYSLIPRGYAGHNTAFHDVDPEPSAERARTLLREAGVETPVRFTYAHRTGPTYAAEAAELRRQLEAGGLFEVKVLEVEWRAFQKGYTSGAYDAYGLGWVPDFPDPDSFTQPLVGRGNTLHNGYASPRVDRLIASTQQYGDRGRAMKDFETIQREVAADVPLIPLWQKKDYVVSTTDVAGSPYLSDGTGIWRLWRLSWI
ncbi:peptide-binding protein [Streptomyces sp. WAC05374]|uniref:ABC transporter substrate-binding protein n=1 Tax=Streptomyces sp. WAC05374 TaxID=2487420 RepID=UPI000F87542D|nr:ABC transporter substrate-binding protein [Streptomyces sp. WAC05374]RST14869.1 peptide-binding protein [Streptomyces sp. WAC05374]TDF37720.1 peptide-binding protein [Streptomyces sp. WAC05374]TDF45629.1 peptide-binding protein [Streptomyces sp. WAC05374]TDF46522.1 peptide-binding protein [Streptomyces sp. WAC05374]